MLKPVPGLLLDGTDVEALDLRSYRRFVSLVPQDPLLFNGSVRDADRIVVTCGGRIEEIGAHHNWHDGIRGH